jgi:lipopolysaccharide transport system ATP-binding protein
MTNPSLVVEGVSKKFGLSLKNALKYGLEDSFYRILGKKQDHTLRPGEFWALNDINFFLNSGDSLGIMGVNGSGKTTLLRILNGTYSPDKGKVVIRGRIGALIAAGAGFSPMLTGRENTYISGTLLGMTPSEIKRKFDEIVDFSELGEFIDMPVRNYSSGMNVRLGFSIAVMGSPDVLLVDEVLAVGDMRFQKKCFERIQALKNAGTTILLVSHAPGSVWSICNKALVLDHGNTNGITSVEDACREYDHLNMMERIESSPTETNDNIIPSESNGSFGMTGDVIVTSLEILDKSFHPVKKIGYGEAFVLRLRLAVMNRVEDGILRVQIDAEINKAISIIDSYEVHNALFDFQPGEYQVDIEIKQPNLRPGVYSFSPSIVAKSIGVHLFFKYNMSRLIIMHPQEAFFYADFRASMHLNASYSVSLQRPPEFNNKLPYN